MPILSAREEKKDGRRGLGERKREKERERDTHTHRDTENQQGERNDFEPFIVN